MPRVRTALAAPRLARDTLLSLLAISLVGASTVVYSVLLGRHGGDTVLGYAGLALAVGLGAAQLATAGLAPATTRFTAVRRAAGDELAARRALVGGVAACIGLGLAVAITALVTAPFWSARVGLPPALLVPAVSLIALQSAYLGLKAGLYGVREVKTYAWVEVAAGGAFAVGLVLVLVDAPVSLLAPFLAANVVFVVLAVPALHRTLAAERLRASSTGDMPAGVCDRDDDPRAGPSMPRYAVIATVGTAAALARVHLAVLATGLAWSAAQVGHLQAAIAFLAPVLLVPRALELALFPALAGAFGRGDASGFRRQTSGALEVSAVGLAVIAGGLIVAGPALLHRLYGPSFAPAQPALDAVLAGAWALGLAVPAVVALSGAEAVAVPNAAGVLGLLVSLATWAWLVPDGGATGAAVGLALGSLATALVPLLAAQRRYAVSLAPMVTVCGRAVVLLLIALVVTRREGVAPLAGAAAYVSLVLLLERGRLATLSAGWRRAAS